MIELRWLERTGEQLLDENGQVYAHRLERVLQSRTNLGPSMHIDETGQICGASVSWSEWADVPTVKAVQSAPYR